MDQEAIRQYVAATFQGVDILVPEEGVGLGDTFFIYDPGRNLNVKQRFPFATIVTKNYGDFDSKSDLDRPGVFRLNIGVSRNTFRSLFGGGDAEAEPDYSELDRLMPHPVYAPQYFVCVLNPSEATFQSLRPLLAEAYDMAVKPVAGRLI